MIITFQEGNYMKLPHLVGMLVGCMRLRWRRSAAGDGGVEW